MNIDELKQADGWYKLDGLQYETLEDLLQCGVLDFCGCGFPGENLLFIKRGLAHINNPHRQTTFDLWKKEGKEVFGNENSEYFFFYWCDKEGLTEHGYSVPGWLTKKGKNLFANLIKYEEELNDADK